MEVITVKSDNLEEIKEKITKFINNKRAKFNEFTNLGYDNDNWLKTVDFRYTECKPIGNLKSVSQNGRGVILEFSEKFAAYVGIGDVAEIDKDRITIHRDPMNYGNIGYINFEEVNEKYPMTFIVSKDTIKMITDKLYNKFIDEQVTISDGDPINKTARIEDISFKIDGCFGGTITIAFKGRTYSCGYGDIVTINNSSFTIKCFDEIVSFYKTRGGI
jgi:hypothetical protein